MRGILQKSNSECIIAFLDFSKVFDWVDQQLLGEVMHLQKVPEPFVAAVALPNRNVLFDYTLYKPPITLCPKITLQSKVTPCRLCITYWCNFMPYFFVEVPCLITVVNNLAYHEQICFDLCYWKWYAVPAGKCCTKCKNAWVSFQCHQV